MRKVLIVDDDDAIRVVLAEFLRGEGFEVLTAHDGLAALDLLEQEQDSLVVLLDRRMPHDGHSVLAWLERVRLLGHHKVVIMPASNPLPKEQQWLADGIISAILLKPFDLDDVLTLVQRLAE